MLVGLGCVDILTSSHGSPQGRQTGTLAYENEAKDCLPTFFGERDGAAGGKEEEVVAVVVDLHVHDQVLHMCIIVCEDGGGVDERAGGPWALIHPRGIHR